MLRLSLFASLLVVLGACRPDADAPEAAELTSAQEVSDAMMAAFDANIGAVEGFTVRAEGAEGRYTVRPDTASMDRVALEVVPPGPLDRPGPGAQLVYNHVPNVHRIAKGLRSATFEGRSSRDGRPVYVLSTDRPESLLGEGGVPAMAGERALRVYVDPETFDILEIYQSFEADSSAFTTRLIYSDFETTDGLRLAHRVVQTTTGLNQAIPETQRIAVGGQIGFALRQAEQMPQGPERAARIAELESELRAVTEGIQELTLEITSVEVGVPAPAPRPASGPPPPSAP